MVKKVTELVNTAYLQEVNTQQGGKPCAENKKALLAQQYALEEEELALAMQGQAVDLAINQKHPEIAREKGIAAPEQGDKEHEPSL